MKNQPVMSKPNSIDKYFQKVMSQPKIARTDEDPSTLPGTSKESTESPGLNRNDPQPEQETQNKGNLLHTPNQPSQYNFPKKRYGNQYRSVQSIWFSEYPWLHYDEKKDSLFCYICSNQYLKGNLASAKNTEQAFISNGFSNWKKALLKFKDHQTSECHKLAVDCEIVLPKTNHNIIDASNSNAQDVRTQNRHCLAKVIESLQYLARQGIPIRGNEDEDSNFIQLLKLRAKDDSVLESWMKDKVQYTSHDVQNEIIAPMANEVIRDLVRETGENYFSLICDEYADISNKEQLPFCLRWVNSNLDAFEDFIGFYQIPNIGADTIASVIQDALQRLPLSIDKCRGQCYDGASNMFGKKTGVATRILQLQPKAHPTHCHGHILSLGVKDLVKCCPTQWILQRN